MTKRTETKVQTTIYKTCI